MKPRAKKEGRIEKPEDKVWKDWYAKLDEKEHEKRLSQLGLDKEDIEEWESHSVFDDLEAEASGALDKAAIPEKKPKKSK